MEIKLDAIAFTDAPTKTQFENAMRDIAQFLNRTAGIMLASGQYAHPKDTVVAQVLNAVTQVQMAFDVSAGTAGLALPQQQGQRPQMVQR